MKKKSKLVEDIVFRKRLKREFLIYLKLFQSFYSRGLPENFYSTVSRIWGYQTHKMFYLGFPCLTSRQ